MVGHVRIALRIFLTIENENTKRFNTVQTVDKSSIGVKKMIKFDITPHCHYCLDFEADVKNAEILYVRDQPIGISDTVVRCKHREECKGIKGYHKMLTKLSLGRVMITEEDFNFLKSFKSLCGDVDEQEQEEIEKSDIDFDDLSGMKLIFNKGGDKT